MSKHKIPVMGRILFSNVTTLLLIMFLPICEATIAFISYETKFAFKDAVKEELGSISIAGRNRSTGIRSR